MIGKGGKSLPACFQQALYSLSSNLSPSAANASVCFSESATFSPVICICAETLDNQPSKMTHCANMGTCLLELHLGVVLRIATIHLEAIHADGLKPRQALLKPPGSSLVREYVSGESHMQVRCFAAVQMSR
eukprot:scaffold222419_cov31-Prasinocladus_malaysianus.AAC.3